MPIVSDHREVLAPEELAGVATGASLRIDILSAGGGASTRRHVRGRSGWALDITDLGCHVRATGDFQPGIVALVAVQRGSDATICRTPMRESTVLVIPGGSEITAAILPSLCYTATIVAMEQWEKIASSVTGRDPETLRSPVAVNLDSARAERIGDVVCSLSAPSRSRSPEGLPGMLTDHLADVAEALADAHGRPPSGRQSSHQRIRQAWAAYDYVMAHLGEAITIDRLCREAGASRRQLEYAFQTVFALSPHEFIERARLNECRRRLIQARDRGGSVIDIAMDVGFNHMSRFAASYQRLFGELPSATRRGRSKHPLREGANAGTGQG